MINVSQKNRIDVNMSNKKTSQVNTQWTPGETGIPVAEDAVPTIKSELKRIVSDARDFVAGKSDEIAKDKLAGDVLAASVGGVFGGMLALGATPLAITVGAPVTVGIAVGAGIGIAAAALMDMNDKLQERENKKLHILLDKIKHIDPELVAKITLLADQNNNGILCQYELRNLINRNMLARSNPLEVLDKNDGAEDGVASLANLRTEMQCFLEEVNQAKTSF